MASTLALDATWDLFLDANGNIALLAAPNSLAQDAASAIKTFLGECYWDTTVGVPWLQQIVGQSPPLALLKQQLVDAALTVPGVASAQVFISAFSNRQVLGQVQVVAATGQVTAANFTIVDLQSTAPPGPTPIPPAPPAPPGAFSPAPFIPTVL